MALPHHMDRAQWEFRQCRVVYRLLCAEARTQTICRFTSLSTHRLSKWRLRWGFEDAERSRGPAPNSFTPFFRCPTLRLEAGYVAVLCKAFGILQPANRTTDTFFCLTTAEQLCDLFEFHRASYPTPTISFDQLLLLARGLVSAQHIQLTHCPICDGALLRDPLQVNRKYCDGCRSINRSRPSQMHGSSALASAGIEGGRVSSPVKDTTQK